METYLPTGIPGFDEILNGGLGAARTYLLVGSAGTGKTLFSVQWLLDGQSRGERGLYISLAEPTDQIQRNIRSFGWQLNGIALRDLMERGNPSVPVGEYHVFPPSDVEQVPSWQAIYQAVEEEQPERLVLDSVTQLRYLSTDEYQFRRQILQLVTFLNDRGCTSILLFEPSEMEREAAVGLAVDGVFHIRSDVSPRRLIGLRTLQVQKLRGSSFLSGLHPFRIMTDGIHIFPHHVEAAGMTEPGEHQQSSGMRELDELLGGGIETGTTTIISGPTGAGKSTLTVSFLRTAAAAGQRTALFSFEESPGSLMARGRAVGLPIDEFVASGQLRLVRVNPMELYPDEFLRLIRATVEHDGVSVLAVDSLHGYQLAMEEFGSPVAHIHNLVTYLNRMGVTTLLINEVQQITGSMDATALGVSYLADNIVLLRYAEVAGHLIKVIGCLKKRAGSFQPELREFRIGSEGLNVGEKLDHFRGILTGMPTYVPPPPE